MRPRLLSLPLFQKHLRPGAALRIDLVTCAAFLAHSSPQLFFPPLLSDTDGENSRGDGVGI